MNFLEFINVFAGMLIISIPFYDKLVELLPGWLSKGLSAAYVLFAAVVAYFLQGK